MTHKTGSQPSAKPLSTRRADELYRAHAAVKRAHLAFDSLVPMGGKCEYAEMVHQEFIDLRVGIKRRLNRVY